MITGVLSFSHSHSSLAELRCQTAWIETSDVFFSSWPPTTSDYPWNLWVLFCFQACGARLSGGSLSLPEKWGWEAAAFYVFLPSFIHSFIYIGIYWRACLNYRFLDLTSEIDSVILVWDLGICIFKKHLADDSEMVLSSTDKSYLSTSVCLSFVIP